MIQKSYAKVNIFLKIVGKRDNYHLLASRFAKVYNLFDLISFEKEKCENFTLQGNFSCALEKNSIYKAYLALSKYENVKEFFKNHKVVVDKKIPEFAGLGGGSSNAATFLNMVNEACSLNLSIDELAKIGFSIGADVPFFVYDYSSANVSGVGEIVQEFKEDRLNIEVFTPNIKCDTAQIFKTFSANFYKECSKEAANTLFQKSSKEILNSHTIDYANDLYKASKSLYPNLGDYEKDTWFFSGSGSSFFRIVDEKN